MSLQMSAIPTITARAGAFSGQAAPDVVVSGQTGGIAQAFTPKKYAITPGSTVTHKFGPYLFWWDSNISGGVGMYGVASATVWIQCAK